MTNLARLFRLPPPAVVAIDGVPYALVTRDREGFILRKLAGGLDTVVLSDAVLVDLHRGGRIRMVEPDECGGRC